MPKFNYPESDNPNSPGLRAEPLLIPPSACALRLPKNFRQVLDDFSREILRHQPLDIDRFGAEYFAELLGKRRRGEPVEYEPKVSYIDAQFRPGDRLIVPTFDNNPKGTQTSHSAHYFEGPESEFFDEEAFYSGPVPGSNLPERRYGPIAEEPEILAPVSTLQIGIREDERIRTLESS